ncbi:MAG: Archaemetzincin [Methanoregulaceae archaeon PtaB.Bin056]|jgi:archaemetzincin|nr:MAG: Archaemetzincin [Methanoregulaceae archaeon PtaB.Bin056]
MDLLIFWDDRAPAGIQAALSRELEYILPLDPKVCESHFVVTGYMPARRQTNAAVLLDSLDLYKKRSGVNGPILLVVSEDLCREGDEYLFGLSRHSTGNAVVSTARLGNEYYGYPPDDGDLIDRLVKESAHEVGHLLGLAHCPYPECIMHNPLILEDIMRQKRAFCPACQAQLQRLS